MDFTPSPRSVELLERLRDFDEQVVRPEEETYRQERRDSGDIRFAPPVMESLKKEARQRGLWNLFMPDARVRRRPVERRLRAVVRADGSLATAR